MEINSFKSRALGVQQLVDEGKYSEAIVAFDKVLQELGENPDKKNADIKDILNAVYYGRGYSYLNTGQAEKALEDFQKLVNLDPQYIDGYVNLGMAYDELGKLAEAEVSYKKALAQDSYNAAVNLADLMTRQGKYQQAIEYCQQAFALDSDNYDLANANIFEAYLNLGDKENALLYAKKLLQGYYQTVNDLKNDWQKYHNSATFKEVIALCSEPDVNLESASNKTYIRIKLAGLLAPGDSLHKNQAEKLKQLELPWMSKLGGSPYLETVEQYPKSAQGEYFFHLAQINFAELPPLPNFPQKGILQFFVLPGKNYGVDLENPTKQEGFRIIYHKNITTERSKLVEDFTFLPQYQIKDEPNFPLVPGTVLKMVFEKREAPTSNTSEARGHKLGGDPHFIQTDPRKNPEFADKNYILLLQLDTDSEHLIQWGNKGVGNFFIPEEDLKKLDFSRVIYHWD